VTAAWRGFSGDVRGPLSLAEDVRNAPFCLLPIGATEQHGHVLPVGTDWMVATEVALGVAAELSAYVLPTLPVGTSMEHRGGAGTAWLRPGTLAAVVRDIVESCAVWGMTKVAVLSGHGGNFILGPTVRELNADNPDRLTVLVPESVMWAGSLTADDLHAGTTETSIACHLFGLQAPGPEADVVPAARREDLNHRSLLSISPTGVWGKPSAATSEHGEAVLGQMIESVTEYLRSAFS